MGASWKLLEAVLGLAGKHLGATWEASGEHLGAPWRLLEAILGLRGQSNQADVNYKGKCSPGQQFSLFYDVFLRVDVKSIINYKGKCSAAE